MSHSGKLHTTARCAWRKAFTRNWEDRALLTQRNALADLLSAHGPIEGG
jgi:hypothetical protein